MSAKKQTPKKLQKIRWCIVGNGPWGLWFGEVRAKDADVIKSKAVRLYRARNIRYWYGKSGGITSLAAHGLCGPRAGESRIGTEIESTLLMDVKAIHECSQEAANTFLAAKQNA